MDNDKLEQIFQEFNPVQNKEEIKWLIEKVEGISPRVILEIGVYFGGTLRIWENLLPIGGFLIGIDIENKVEWDITKSDRNIQIIIGNSQKRSTIEAIKEILEGRLVDFLFIDGGHKIDTIMADYHNYSDFVRPGGIIGFHDIAAKTPICDVKDFWQEILQPKEELIIASGIGILRK